MRPHSLIRADLVTAAVLLSLGLFVVVEAWRMPRLEERQINPLTVPGIVPGLLGLVLVAMASVLLIRSIRAGGLKSAAEATGEGGGDGSSWRRLGLTAALCLAYAAGLVGHVDFRLATGLFVFAFVALFEWDPGQSLIRHGRTVGWAAVQAALVALAVAVVFQELFLVRLP